MQHLIGVLKGSKCQSILSRGHEKLSTYNLMSESSEAELRYYVESLIGLGLLEYAGDHYPVLKWTEHSRAVIKEGKKVEFRKKIFKEKIKEGLPSNCNEELLTLLKKLRLEVSRQEGLPPFGVFADRSLIEMATFFPANDTAFLSINGVGRFKLGAYGVRFMNAIREFCQARGLLQLQTALTANEIEKSTSGYIIKSAVSESADNTLQLFLQNKTLTEIAQTRGLNTGTIVNHLAEAIERGIKIDLSRIISEERKNTILTVILEVGGERLKPIKDKLPECSYDEIRLVLADHKGEKNPVLNR